MIVTFIRHGETESNAKRRYIGRTDEQLSVNGKEYLIRRKKEGYYPKADCLYVSPMLRCRQTAKILYPDINPHIIEAFKEMDFGVFEGKNHEELNGREDYQAWLDSRCELTIPNGESKSGFSERTLQAWNSIIKQPVAFKDESYNMVLVVHGGTVKAILSSLLGGDYFDYDIKNGEKISIEYNQEKACAKIRR